MSNLESHVSMEFLKIGTRTHLPVELLGVVEKMFQRVKNNEVLTDSHGGEIAKVIQKNTGINMAFKWVSNDPGMLGILTTWTGGHAGTDARWGEGSERLDHKEFTAGIMTGTVDLEKVKVTGAFTKFPMTIFMDPGYFKPERGYTAEEITAGLLHEVGHGFFTFATLGDYVWLNYYLTDGVDIALGKKPNVYKVKLLTPEYMQKTLTAMSEKDLADELKHPTEVNVKKAFLAMVGATNRNQLDSTPGFGQYLRDEQLADMFVSRVGFGRPLVAMLSRLSKEFGGDARHFRTRFTFIQVEVLKILGWGGATYLFPVLPPLLLLLGVSVVGHNATPYDNLTERFIKVKRDLVAQVRNRDVLPSYKEALLADIAVIDNTLKAMNQYRTAFETVSNFFNPHYRRKQHRLKTEERLEALLNSDLFIHSERLKLLA